MEGFQPSAESMGSFRSVSPLLGALRSFGWGRGCWRWRALYAGSMSLGPSIVRPALVAHVRRYAWRTRRVGHCKTARNGAWWAPHWAMYFICEGMNHTILMVAPRRLRVSTVPAECRRSTLDVPHRHYGPQS